MESDPGYIANLFLSTPSARRATRCFFVFAQSFVISIHALREEGDAIFWSPSMYSVNFYPRPPRGGRRLGEAGLPLIDDFYPRPPRGGRRSPAQRAARLVQFLSTPSARRATLSGYTLQTSRTISIHALREEGDRRCQGRRGWHSPISIHALREEGDLLR